MSLILEKCIEYNEMREEHSASEAGKTYMLYNASGFKVKKIKVDECFPQTAGQKRCDFLLLVEARKRAIFVELKGGGLTKACKQLLSTILYLRREIAGLQVDARIVGTKGVPRLADSIEYRKLAKEVKPTGGTIGYRTNKFYLENI